MYIYIRYIYTLLIYRGTEWEWLIQVRGQDEDESLMGADAQGGQTEVAQGQAAQANNGTTEVSCYSVHFKRCELKVLWMKESLKKS